MGSCSVNSMEDSRVYHGAARVPVTGGTYRILWECDHDHPTHAEALECAEKNTPPQTYESYYGSRSR